MRKWALILFLLTFLTVTTFVARSSYARAEDQIEVAASVETPQEAVELPLLVNLDNPLPDDYEPTELIDMYKYKRNFKLADSGMYIEAHVFEAMKALFKAAKADGMTGYIVTSGYRTEKQQKKIYKNDKEGVAIKPGHSEHQTGLAFDVGVTSGAKFGTTKQFKWMKAHCAEYGFILRYLKNKAEITRIPYEPWHYRYVGVEHATKIMAAKVCLEEYIAAGGNVEMSVEEAEEALSPAA